MIRPFVQNKKFSNLVGAIRALQLARTTVGFQSTISPRLINASGRPNQKRGNRGLPPADPRCEFMDIRHLRYFITVAEQSNVTRAAELLHTSQPSLSRQIQDLEDTLKVKLFIRERGRLQLTQAGQAFLSDARKLIADLNAAVERARAAARGVSGSIVIGYIASATVKVFSSLLPLFQQRFPAIKPELRAMTSPEQIEALREGRIDVAFLRGLIRDDTITSEVLLSENLVVVLPANHPLAKKRSLRINDLLDLPFVRVSSPMEAHLRQCFHPADFLRSSGLGDGDHDALIDKLTLIGSGMGYSILGDAVRTFAPVTVAVRPIAAVPQPKVDLIMAFRNNNSSRSLQSFLSVVQYWSGMYTKRGTGKC
jgi:LysR family hca operon transcriptional activator